MGKRASKKKTRKDKIAESREPRQGVEDRSQRAEIRNPKPDAKINYESLSSTGKAAAKRVAILVQRPIDYVLNPELSS